MKTNINVILLTALIAGVVAQPIAAVNWKQVALITTGVVTIGGLGYCIYKNVEAKNLEAKKELIKQKYNLIKSYISCCEQKSSESLINTITKKIADTIATAKKDNYLRDLLLYKHHAIELKGLEFIPTATDLRDLAKGTPCEELINSYYTKYNL